jgi:transposase
MFVTDDQWEWLAPHLEFEAKDTGRPRRSAREVFEAVLFMLHTGIQYRYLPAGFPPKSTVHAYLKRWCQEQRFRNLLALLIVRLRETGRLDLRRGFIDATFAQAKCGGDGIGLTRKGKGTKLQIVTDAQGVPLGLSVAPATSGEPQMVQQTLAFSNEEWLPTQLVGDRGYDSDALDFMLEDMGIEMIAPNRSNRRPENMTQDKRKLKCYKNRWVVERTFAWLQNHRRLLVRYEKHLNIYLGLTTLGCLMICLRKIAPCWLC